MIQDSTPTMRVLVTGNEGYIGSVLTSHLQHAGHYTCGLDMGTFRDVSFIPRIPPHEQRYQDIRSVSADDLANIDAIVHLAALSNDPLGELDPKLTHAINYEATLNLAHAAKTAGVKRFIFASSCSIYGQSAAALVNESTPLDPHTAYAKSKVKAEHDLISLADEHFTPIIMRNATAFGLSPRLRLDLVVQNLTATGFTTGTIEVLSDGTPWRPLVHVNDIATATLHLLTAPATLAAGQAFNIGHQDNNVQIKDIATTVADVIPDTAIHINTAHSPDERSYRVDFSKVYALRWQPTHTVRHGVEELYSAFKQANFTKTESEQPNYHTLKHYQQLMEKGTLDNHLQIRQPIEVN